MIEGAIPTLVLIGLAAVLAPIVAEWSRRFVAVPEVVIQIVFGILLGPYVLNLAHPNSLVTSLADFGLTYLMFLAGTELDLSAMRQGHLGRAAGAWVASLALALAVGVLLRATGLVLDHVVVALCLTTTALGTLLPILQRRRSPAHSGRPFHPVGGRDRRVRPGRGSRRAAHEP
jgi:Kef-type K+ transport system membrane component KefB